MIKDHTFAETRINEYANIIEFINYFTKHVKFSVKQV